MAKLGQVHWHEGLFLQPHHLQLMQHQVLGQFSAERRAAMPYPYGILDYRLSSDALEDCLVQCNRLHAIMPSGVIVDVPDGADLPALDIKGVYGSSSAPFTIYLGIPLWYAARANAIERGSAADARVKRLFRVEDVAWPDENTGENPQPLLVRRINARLMLEDEDRTDMEVLPLVRIIHATEEDTGTPRQDPSFIPPCFHLNGSPVLRDLVRDLAHQVEATRGALVNQITRRGFSWETARSDQIESILRLGTLNAYGAHLRQLVQAPCVTPFEAYLALRDLLGYLAALYPEDDQYEVADYDHDSPAVCFQDLCAKVRRLLRGKAPIPVLKVPFKLAGNVQVAMLTDEQLTRPSEYFLGIRTKQDPAELTKLVENRDEFKLMARSLADMAIWGILLKEERFPPFGLPVERGLHYFRLLRGESRRMWERIGQEKSMAIRFPGVETSDYSITLFMTITEEAPEKK
ncbi:MAG: type VI secretion system baseplate subunit TssK [Planctomycetes bacterium]|nr:type VI secretion system baseplate subunit TssK [Planctomycetota bacterium]